MKLLLLQILQDDFLDAISRGFSSNPTESTLAALGILSFPVLLFIIYRIQFQSKRRDLVLQWNKRFNSLIHKYDLTLNEIDIIKKFSRFLKEPEKKYMILLNKNTFNFCFEQWEKKYPRYQLAGISLLRTKLEFDKYDPLESPKSTYTLYTGMAVKIRPLDSPHLKWVDARIKSISDASIELESFEIYDPLQMGTKIKLALHDYRGVFLFESQIIGQEQNIIQVKHSRSRLVVQRREYYRKKLNMKILIKKEHIENQVTESRLIELSGSGASLINPQKMFNKHDDLRFFFHIDEHKWQQVSGEVVRLSQEGEVMHVRFGHMKDNIRDEIIGLIF